ncbi:MAG: hypothetical protein IH921_15330, partial [Gemmatimonadetes bacterium]|nr:hypothetical protein [Gemmatimonadota bacterium]
MVVSAPIRHAFLDFLTVLDSLCGYGRDQTRDLTVRGEPDMAVLAFGSDDFDCYALSSAMRKRGWDIERLQRPKNLNIASGLGEQGTDQCNRRPGNR